MRSVFDGIHLESKRKNRRRYVHLPSEEQSQNAWKLALLYFFLFFSLPKKKKVLGIRNNEARYPCCGGDDSIQGCQMGAAHVFDTLRESELLRFVETPKPNGPHDPRSHKVQ